MALRFTRQGYASAAIAAVAVILTAVSLNHLANGVEIVTGTGHIESWATAVSIDLGYLALEFGSLLAATEAIHRSIATYTRPAVAITMAVSAALNAFAFAAHATDWHVYVAAALGLSVPALIFVTSKVAAKLWIRQSR